MVKFIVAFLTLSPAFSWAETSYVVRKGDTLLKIADRALEAEGKKDPRRYEYAKRIHNLNPELEDPNALEVGQTLIVPGEEEHEQKVEAVAPAKAPEPPPPAVTEHEQTTPPPESKMVPTPVPVPTQNPAHAPMPVEVAKPAEPAAHKNFFFLQPRYQMLKISAEDTTRNTKGEMKSESSFGLDLQYGVILSDRYHLLLQAGVTQTQFKNIEGDATAVNHKSETLKTFAVGMAFDATHTLHLDLMAMYADRTFLLPETATDYKLEAVAIPGAELNISWDFYSGSTNIFGVSAIGEYVAALSKDGVDYKETFEPFGALYWKSNRGHDHMNYKATVTYKQGHQKTSVSKQSEDLTVLGFGIWF